MVYDAWVVSEATPFGAKTLKFFEIADYRSWEQKRLVAQRAD
jgi:hypothetical protein